MIASSKIKNAAKYTRVKISENFPVEKIDFVVETVSFFPIALPTRASEACAKHQVHRKI